VQFGLTTFPAATGLTSFSTPFVSATASASNNRSTFLTIFFALVIKRADEIRMLLSSSSRELIVY